MNIGRTHGDAEKKSEKFMTSEDVTLIAVSLIAVPYGAPWVFIKFGLQDTAKVPEQAGAQIRN